MSSWHDAWQAAALRVQTAAASRGDFARIPEIGRAAMARLPEHQISQAMDSLYEAYWNYRLGWDIRRLLEDDDVADISVSAMTAAIEQARNQGQNTVTVSRDHLALLLENHERLALHTRHCPSEQDGDAQ